MMRWYRRWRMRRLGAFAVLLQTVVAQNGDDAYWGDALAANKLGRINARIAYHQALLGIPVARVVHDA